VRFTCEKCGRAYAADERLATRGFRIRCRQCGELIVVPARGAPPGAVPLAIGTPLPGGIVAPGPPGEIALTLRDRPPRPGETEEDPFASLAAELATVPEAPPILPERSWYSPPHGVQAPDASGEPETTGAEADRALAEIGRRMEVTTGSTPLEVTAGRVVQYAPAPTPPPRAAPEPPRTAPAAAPPRTRRWIAAGVGLAAGVLVAVAVALVLDRRPAPEVAPLPPPGPAAPAVAAPAAAAPVAAPARAAAAPATAARATAEPARPVPVARARPGPAQGAGTRAAPPGRRAAPEERRRVAARPEARRPPAGPAVAAAPSRPVRAAVPAPAPPAPAPPPRAERQLGDLQIQATIARHADAFQACAAQARREEAHLVAETRRVTVTMTVTPGGKVLYPTLDDAELSGSALGACLKQEALRMSFPPSDGEAVRVRMALVLR
jgi:DNA-directed RNA polymerase subunit RPC12/RpoP